ncbi:hypothetical protein LX32DRAFT_238235 [Colletotrichum zoysiae]|uniref:Uncharacterized protein n=1 Tax=Colletotrichum zoysiae TaxID=1216348 RepID=A0AAD9HMV7_9PEZI|nr:hypothetical protein LX32DRAFT_238235 [Colletotrichum zoysiae]
MRLLPLPFHPLPPSPLLPRGSLAERNAKNCRQGFRGPMTEPPDPIPTSGAFPCIVCLCSFRAHVELAASAFNTVPGWTPVPPVSSRHAQLSPRVPPRPPFSFSVKTGPDTCGCRLIAYIVSLCVPVRFFRGRDHIFRRRHGTDRTHLNRLYSQLYCLAPPSLPIVAKRAAWNNEGGLSCPAPSGSRSAATGRCRRRRIGKTRPHLREPYICASPRDRPRSTSTPCGMCCCAVVVV